MNDTLPGAQVTALPSPATVLDQMPLAAPVAVQISQHRHAIREVISGDDSRLLVVTGPCSIHDPQAAYDYGRRLAALQSELGDKMLLVMRCYFEKPRTTVGWKGLLHDPAMDGSHDMEKGITLGREVLLELAGMGLPLATEALNPLSMNYLQDTLSWVAVGARTTESQPHREMASGLSMPVGFKNATDGSFGVAVNAIKSAAQPHSFLGVDADGRMGVMRTSGNAHCHIVLRGGNGRPNYDELSIARCEHALENAGLAPRIMVDCSHENSAKNHLKQAEVLADIGRQIQAGNRSILGVMLESFIEEGRQEIAAEMCYGQSVTDACLSWEQTEMALRSLHQQLPDSQS
ncbi:MAG: 3-deoxy-7-phosphoheptulonate synthase [Hahellaceae bacterium]|nr:3-deoxy-7-phosphoheptulonate synthase [Hahellaceae bacterium]MCP5169638.1 3-deoxy-7-phosphoheptulonate synthase [Hahellaceae bacterium]